MPPRPPDKYRYRIYVTIIVPGGFWGKSDAGIGCDRNKRKLRRPVYLRAFGVLYRVNPAQGWFSFHRFFGGYRYISFSLPHLLCGDTLPQAYTQI